MTDDLTLAKAALRRRARARRRALALDPAAAGVRAADHFPIETAGPSAPGLVVAGYRPRGTEIDPWPLLRRLEAELERLATRDGVSVSWLIKKGCEMLIERANDGPLLPGLIGERDGAG